MDVEEFRKQAWNSAFESFGTAYIFERRAAKYRQRLTVLNFLGIVVPLVLGGTVATFGTNIKPFFIAALGIVSIFQLIGSAWSLNAKWDDAYADARESMVANIKLRRQYEQFGRNPPTDATEFKLRFEVLEAVANQQEEDDLKQGVSDQERRMGMRAALRQYQKRCIRCDRIPSSMQPSNCEVCGNFSRRLL